LLATARRALGRLRSGRARLDWAGRRPLRLRLTLVYSGLFLLAGVVLLGTTYGLVAHSLGASVAVAGAPYENPAVKICSVEDLTPNQVAKCKAQAEQSLQESAKAAAMSQRAQALRHLMSYSLAALGAVVLVSAWLGWIVAGRALRPLHAITAAARRASEENLGERIALAGPDDELKELADTFDAMLARLDAAFASQRRFVADASHELRTPLTVMRAAIDVTLAKPGRSLAQLESMAIEVRQAVDRAEALIEALLTLARSDRGAGPREQLDVAVLAEDALDAAAPAIRARPVSVEAALLPGLALGDPVLIERLVTNLVDNAVRHNVPDGWVQVATGIRGGMAFIEVANGGAPIPAEAVPSLFEPFRRLSERAGPPDGTGLGLSIVRSVTLAHRGQLTARSRPAGGLEVSVLFPGCAEPP
jgi:signal transduction histidine kinase